jgi:hypothetical protein
MKHMRTVAITIVLLIAAFLAFRFLRPATKDQMDVRASAPPASSTIQAAPSPAEPQSVLEPTKHLETDSELLRLRGEVAVLRTTLRETTNRTSPSSASADPQQIVSADQFSDRGLATPEASIQTLCWAAFAGNKDRYKQSIAWGEEAIRTARSQSGPDFDTNNIFFTPSNPGGRIEGFQIVSTQPIAPDRIQATVITSARNANTETRNVKNIQLIRIADEWKWYVPSPADVGAIPFIADPN